MIKDKNYYKSIDYDIIVDKLSKEDGGGYFAYYKDIPSVMGDGETKDEAIEDVKKAFDSYVEVSIKNRDIVKEPINLHKREKINITIPKDKLIGLDLYVKEHHTNRSQVLTTLTSMLLNQRIDINSI
ncbi:MAG: type II toxin-antitoxin system HicB family antitoxin [Epsilonproteobacteria bacterium]|nr:type II toxin-antitoxin system HicB family antitoxin [Campylobacterota bacterium]